MFIEVFLMPELKIEKKDKNHVEITFKGEDISIVSAIREVLMENDDVEFAAVKQDHIEIEDSILIVKTKKGNPIPLIAKAAEKIAKQAGELAKSL
jgi:DNA-directed RNA polymerase subunit L